RARVVRGRDPAPPAAVLDGRVLGELLAAPERHDHAARLEEDDVVLRRGAALPAERLVERPCPREIAHPERDEAEPLLHARSSNPPRQYSSCRRTQDWLRPPSSRPLGTMSR